MNKEKFIWVVEDDTRYKNTLVYSTEKEARESCIGGEVVHKVQLVSSVKAIEDSIRFEEVK